MEQTHTSQNGAAATPGAQRRVLVVEDDPTIVDAVAARLRAEGFLVQTAARRAGRGRRGAEAWQPDLVVLDVMLPGFDGLEVCRRIQAERPVPVLMLTARDDETDMLVGLGVGADDYLTKPFSHAGAGRAGARPAAPGRAGGAGRRRRRAAASCGSASWRSTAPQRRVRVRGEEVHLTPTEFDLLVCLAATPARGAHPRAAAGRGVGLGGRLRHPHRRQPRQGAAPQARRRPDPHRARRRLRAGDADAMSRRRPARAG